MRKIEPLTVAVFAALLWLGFYGGQIGGCPVTPPVDPVDPAKQLIVVLYEADHGEPPAYAAGAVNELRKAKRNARMMDDDPATGMNSVPIEVAPAIEPGRKIMGGTDGKGHALVLLAGSTVVKAIALPASKEAILEACQ